MEFDRKRTEAENRMQRVSIRSRSSSGPRGAVLTMASRRAARNAAVARKRMFDQAYQDIYGESPAMVPSSSIARQALRTGGWASPSLGGELKFTDVNTAIAVGGAGAATFGTGILLNGLANGSDASSRIGRKVNIKSLYIRWSALFVAGAGGGGAIRILVVYDKQANATAPAITDILLANDFNSPNNLSNRDRFVTLCDYVTEQLSTASNLSDTGVIQKTLNLETMFNAGSAGTIGDITSGSVYMFIAQSGGITTTAPTLAYRARIRYTDV